MTITNWAVSGDNSFDLLEHLSKKTLPACDWAIVFIGANDLAQHKQVFLGEYRDNLTEIARCLKGHLPAERICLLAPSPVDETKQAYRTNRLVALYGEVVGQIAVQEGLAFLDTLALFEGADQLLSTLLQGSLDDGLHFGSSAYKVLAEAIVAQFLCTA